MKRKILILVGLTFTFGLTFGQELVTKKSITIVCVGKLDSCGSKAFKIVGDTVLIDTCFDNKKKIFTVDGTTLVKNNNLFSQVIATTELKWQQMENDLDKIDNCDYVIPFEIIICDNNKIVKFSLKRFRNCYPISSKQILERLDSYFD